MLAHELRNPLAPICNALEILRVKTPSSSVVWTGIDCGSGWFGPWLGMPDDSAPERPNPVHVAIAQLEEEMAAVFMRSNIPSQTRLSLEQRLRELKKKAGMQSG